MKFEKESLHYEGKGKKVFTVKNFDDLLWLEFKDQLTAFNALKKGEFANKGELNCKIANLIFKILKKNKIPTHLVEELTSTENIVEKLKMIPLEVVVRNVIAGSLAKKFMMEEGKKLDKPLVEFFYKKDEWSDPFINDDHALLLGAVKSVAELDELRTLALRVNEVLIQTMSAINIELVDFKLEFGRNSKEQIILGDEITPDSCRLWDKKSGEKLDKDRFRRDLGKVKEAYEEVWTRLSYFWGGKV
ncbi:MAG: phosphoribosylaminoimidazolesuccinocarboxamide synthase [Pseudomonadota bacterium]|nr:phosphoribosylaminoimidazolesuccinocarboxamide synthase [Pseudomonadota bacterium]